MGTAFAAALLTGVLALAELAYCNTEDLGNGGISGPLVPQLGGLKNLQYLKLYENALNGSIPTTLGDLSNLVSLELQRNLLTGTIPASLGDISTLQYLRLNGNKLSGSIPASLGKIKRLHVLRLDGNLLTGTVPPEILSLTSAGNLSELNTTNNNLTATVKSGGLRGTNAHAIFSFGRLSFLLVLSSVFFF